MASTEITIIRGDDVTFTVQINDANGDGINITGATLFFTVKKFPDDTDANALISKDQSSHTDASGGTTSITLSNSETDIKPGTYHYDFQLVTSGGDVTTYGVGRFIVKQDITLRTS